MLINKRLVKVADFKLSMLLEKDDKFSKQAGTPFYASPEMWAEHPYDFKSDVWSLGCIVYEMAKL